MEWSSKVLVLVCLASLGSTQVAEKLTGQNPCSAKPTCSECIQTKSCAWCFEPNYAGDRCFQPSLVPFNARCPEQFTYDPDNYVFNKDSRELTRVRGGAGMAKGGASMSSSSSGSVSSSSSGSSSMSGSASGAADAQIVQISPQKIDLHLRINEVHKLSIAYSQAEDYPVDLYYLMDLSKSMEDDKEKLSALGDLLSDSMRNITSNFKLGFGSFVDKIVMPYVSTVPKNLIEPCTRCAAPYGYHNKMPLSSDTKRFNGEVRNASVSGNLDAPEGGFDAIMQAVVCRNEIGWREKARRLLVFSTDAGFHYAGDGKLGGIVEPNDGLCHLNATGDYTHSTLQDYPSISQINLKVKQNAINVIFAVTAEQIGVYEKLREHIEGSTCGVLTADSSNVVDLVKEQYDKISSSVEMKDNSTSGVQVQYYSSCLGNGPAIPTNKCDGLKVGDVVNFYAEIMVTQCPENPAEWNQVFQIYPVGINESLVVNLKMICDCPCERQGNSNYQERSPHCSDVGTYACGVCMCGPNYFGHNCECSQDGRGGSSSMSASNNTCRKPGIATGLECSGRGNCLCGQCECEKRTNPDERISGTYCECDNFSCDRHNGLLCSGPTKGQCVCGECVCNEGWSGSACDCRASNETCIPPVGGEVCSGHGECICGQCVCGVGDDGRYSGRYCDKCPTCPGRCAEFKDCVQCKMYQTGPLSKEDCEKNCTFEPKHVDGIIIANEEKDEHLCAYYDEDDCRFAYVYAYDEKDRVIIRAQEKRICPPQVFILGIVLGVIAAIVLMGLALLMLWKMITTIHDRREFARFEKERTMAKWDTGENPIYKQATSTFKNPTYAGK